jgi:Tol biopolymer transport system component
LQPARFGHFTVSASGLLVYPGSARAPSSSLVWKDRNGRQLATLETLAADIIEIHLSPDRRALLASVTERSSNDLWIYDLERGRRDRFTFDPGAEPYAIWTPDGKTIIWRTGPGDLYRKASNLAGTDELLFSGQGFTPTSISADGTTLLHTKGGVDIWALSLAPQKAGASLEARPWLDTAAGEDQAQFSPDGRWVAYTSDESKVREVYVAPYPGPGGKRQVSSGGASHVRWRRDGRELFYVMRNGDLMATGIGVRGETLELGRTQRLFGGLGINIGYLYDASLDGSRFVVAEGIAARNPPLSLTLVENWPGLLSRDR